MLTTETPGRFVVLETPHTSDPALDAAIVLLETIIQINASPVTCRQLLTDTALIGTDCGIEFRYRLHMSK
jgi:hypothetical protein